MSRQEPIENALGTDFNQEGLCERRLDHLMLLTNRRAGADTVALVDYLTGIVRPSDVKRLAGLI